METIIQKFKKLHQKGEKISVVTCYDASFARIVGASNIDCILVGDSLGMVVQGEPSTLPVSLEDMIYHAKAVRRGAPNSWIVCDLPFLSYQTSLKSGLKSAGKIMKKTGVDAVKLEGASKLFLEQVRMLTDMGIPVMGHLGLTPQSFQVLGGYKVQGKDVQSRTKILEDAKALEEAGVFSLVLEMIPEELGKEVTESLSIPTIGIGAGRHTSGQVLVIYDLLGMNSDFNPKFLKKYANLNKIIESALIDYSKDVKESNFPTQENIF